MKAPPKRPFRWILVALFCLWGCTSCANMSFQRETEDSGRFRSTGWAFTFLSFDLPDTAIGIARSNAADSGLPNLLIESETIIPDFGVLNWVLDILSIRYARVDGTFGFSSDAASRGRSN